MKGALTLLGILLATFLAGCAESGVEVSREQFGEAWPLTVEAGRVDCVQGSEAIFIHQGTRYALNGTARSRGRDRYVPVDVIWAIDESYPAVPGQPRVRINIGPLINLALQQCE